MNEFQTNNYTVIKNAISEEVAAFIEEYFTLKEKVAKKLFEDKIISPYDEVFGTFRDEQVPGAYSHYADVAMEVLLQALHPRMEYTTGLKLNPNYSYARVYRKGHELTRHIDRFSCEISTTLNLGGDMWPIYLEPSGESGKEGIAVNLSPGDMLVYKGNILEHWREPFEGERCTQVFLHYNNVETKDAKLNDGRPFIGLPSCYLVRK